MVISIEGDLVLKELGEKLHVSPDDLYTGLWKYWIEHGETGRAKFIEDLEKRLAKEQG